MYIKKKKKRSLDQANFLFIHRHLSFSLTHTRVVHITTSVLCNIAFIYVYKRKYYLEHPVLSSYHPTNFIGSSKTTDRIQYDYSRITIITTTNTITILLSLVLSYELLSRKRTRRNGEQRRGEKRSCALEASSCTEEKLCGRVFETTLWQIFNTNNLNSRSIFIRYLNSICFSRVINNCPSFTYM